MDVFNLKGHIFISFALQIEHSDIVAVAQHLVEKEPVIVAVLAEAFLVPEETIIDALLGSGLFRFDVKTQAFTLAQDDDEEKEGKESKNGQSGNHKSSSAGVCNDGSVAMDVFGIGGGADTTQSKASLPCNISLSGMQSQRGSRARSPCILDSLAKKGRYTDIAKEAEEASRCTQHGDVRETSPENNHGKSEREKEREDSMEPSMREDASRNITGGYVDDLDTHLAAPSSDLLPSPAPLQSLDVNAHVSAAGAPHACATPYSTQATNSHISAALGSDSHASSLYSHGSPPPTTSTPSTSLASAKRHFNKTPGSVFVGNLDPSVTELLLGELFMQCGVVEDVFIPRDGQGVSRGFGFVEYSEESVVPYACSLFDKLLVFGKPLRVQAALQES